MEKCLRSLAAVLIFLVCTCDLYSQEKEKYSLVRISGSPDGIAEALASSDLHIDHAISKPGFTEAWLSQEEIRLLGNSGVQYRIIVPDWESYYSSLPKMTGRELNATASRVQSEYGITHPIYGTMGGYLRPNEVINKLDSMRIQYPNLISAKFTIGTSVQGRPIWTVRLTKNPDASTGRPEIWYHSLIHAREPMSMQHMIFFMYWLLENYGIDPVATYIIENRELYFTPVLNPDGYRYNDSTSVNGGGMWRKNRRNNGTSFGVDLNRNYGLYQYWNSSNNGSSTSPSSDTYRGTSPFSEPETMAAMNFVNGRNINAIMGSHTYGNYIIKPWAWQDPTPTPDDNKFNLYLSDMSADNGYKTGTPFQTVGYRVRGSADDWYYNDSVHSPHRIIAVTPESGTTGFWPTQAEIIPIAESMLFSNKYMALIGGAYTAPESVTLDKQAYVSGESGTLKIVFRNKGVLSASNVKIAVTSGSFYLNVPIDQFNFAQLASFQKDSSVFGFQISPAVPAGNALPLNINIIQDGDTIHTQKKYVTVGNGIVTLADSAENGFSKWTTNLGWNTTTAQYYSPTRSFTDSPSGNYADNTNSSMTLALPLNLSISPVAYLSFRHKYTTEAGYDFCYVEVSADNGSSWKSLKSYNGTLSSWELQSFDITSFANSSSQVKIRFRLTSDVSVTADGWYVDDIRLITYSLLSGPVPSVLNLKFAMQGFVNMSGNLNMTDTVQVSLRSAVAPYTLSETAAGVIDPVSKQGSFGFINTPSGNYYIVVNHRNTIETWSKAGGESFVFGAPFVYDFTTAASKAYGNNLVQTGTFYSAYSGDVNQDGLVDVADALLADNDIYQFSSGYLVTDVNGDGIVDLFDALIIDNNASSFVQVISP